MALSTKKAQSSLDFLLTYAWALLLVVVVVAALFALGIFDPLSLTGNSASGFSNMGIVGWSFYDNGTVGLQFENHFGRDVDITNITINYKNETKMSDQIISLTTGKQTNKLSVGDFSAPPSLGNPYTLHVTIYFTDSQSDWTYADYGTLVGKVQPQ